MSSKLLSAIKYIREVVLISTAIATVLIAYHAADTWKDEMKFKERYGVATAILSNTYSLRDSIRDIRFRFDPKSDLIQLRDDPRLQFLRNAIDQTKQIISSAEVYLGNDEKLALEKVVRIAQALDATLQFAITNQDENKINLYLRNQLGIDDDDVTVFVDPFQWARRDVFGRELRTSVKNLQLLVRQHTQLE